MHDQEMILEDGTTVILIHLVHKTPSGWSIACVPNLEEKNFSATDRRDHPWRRSDDPRAITCMLCKATKAYKVSMEKLRQPVIIDQQVSIEGRLYNAIHFLTQTDLGLAVVCAANSKKASEDVRAVTCSSCKGTSIFREQREKLLGILQAS